MFFTHEATMSFDTPGLKAIQIHGLRVPPDTEQGEPAIFERTIEIVE